LRKEKVKSVVVLTNPKFFLPELSTTFQGRDLFAPVAAHLSLGVRPEAFGSIIKSWEELNFRKPEAKGGELVGEVLHIDTFGNLVTNIDEGGLLSFTKGHAFVIKVGKRRIRGLKKGYWEGRKREPIVLLGSAGFLEISVREENAQKLLKIKRGDRVTVQIRREQMGDG